jgi:RNA polymerase sigma-70 factor (ECF subfamily)
VNDDLAAVYRREVGRCTATLIRVLGDVDLAEDAVAEAFAVAAERWPTTGIPPNPGGWITTTARNRAIDRLRRESTRRQRQLAAHHLHGGTMAQEPDRTAPDDVERLDALDAFVDVVADDQLRLMFLCCHPALAPDVQVALTLRLLGGLDVARIAGCFLVPEATMAQRLVRAKRKLRDNHASYEVPGAERLPDRLPPVLHAISLIFTAGHSGGPGEELVRADLCDEAVRLARVLAELMPDEPEAAGLLALLVLTEARRPARTAADGSFVRLSDQDRSRWDRELIAEGTTLVRACRRRGRPGPFQVQAAIAAEHSAAPSAADTDWARIVALYDLLHALRPDDVVALNRAVAVAELRGPEAALGQLDALDEGRLDAHQPYHATRADLLARAGRWGDAVVAYDQAIALSANAVEAAFLRDRRGRAAAGGAAGDGAARNGGAGNGVAEDGGVPGIDRPGDGR